MDARHDLGAADLAFARRVAGALAAVPGVLAVALGGSRAAGTHRPDSDWDFSLYYRGEFDPAGLRRLGWPGEVFPVGGWGGGVFNGGAWLEIDGARVDVHYRDLDDVELRLAQARTGRFKVERLAFHLAGIPTYIVVSELAENVVLHGTLPSPGGYPDPLRRAARDRWLSDARNTLMYARQGHAPRGHVSDTAGAIALALLQAAHAVLAARGEWVTNEKTLIDRAGLRRGGDAILAGVAGAGPGALATAVDAASALIEEAFAAPELCSNKGTTDVMSEHAHTSHGARGHAHGLEPGADRRLLAWAGALIVAFMGAEVAAGLIAHSLALLSDAAHMLTDAAAIALVLVTMKVAARPARGGYTYGLRRLEILSAQANGITLVLLALWLCYEAARRLIAPHPVTGGLMLGVAVAGVAVNLAAAWLLDRARRGPGQRRSLNAEGAFAHILTDLYAFGATVAAAIVVLATGFDRADAIATLVVVALMLRAGFGLIKASGRIFLEAAPAGVDPESIGAALVSRPHVAEVHDLHVWEITSGMPAASAHVLVARRQDCHAIRADLMKLLASEFGITHATLQVDHVPPTLTLAAHDPGDAVPDPGDESARHCGDPHGPSYRAERAT